ncbi:chromatin modification-related protein EAF7 [Harpegnathos saltator]|uniref:HIRA-interacting protein 3 n=1 Tax=Harpegnathos saltator TaxID=610380 RepID=E2C3Z3_HARSA|nr:chromatin modification-related protein EAF7 [Harpegnathos saltator]EFN77379.1 HIRA-interacting protein 3 [Harpegnathos saltator]
MVNSDHSEVEEDDMDKLELSDSIKLTTTKRSRIDSGDEDGQDTPAKKRRCSFSKESGMSETNNTEIASDKNGIDKNIKKEETDTVSPENKPDQDEKSDSNIKNEEDQGNKLMSTQVKKEDLIEDKNNSTMDESVIKVEEKTTENKDSPSKESLSTKTVPTFDDEKTEEDDEIVKKKADDTDDCKENSEGNRAREKHTAKNRTIDTEVVDGLELSVECASDKEGSSSESTDEKEIKPRPKTLIVKAEPNESELECGSSEDEKSDTQKTSDKVTTKLEKKKGKRRGKRTSFSKLKTSGSEDSQNNNSDEDYSPRTKKKVKKSPAPKRSTKRSTESKRGRGGAKKNSHKRNTEDTSDDENLDTISADKTDETMKKNEAEEKLSGKESSASKSEDESNSEDEEKSKKARRSRRRSSTKPEDNKQIQLLKKYIKTAGIRVKSYQEIWADCRYNTQRINRLKELLEKHGVTGRPTLEKCKRAKEKHEKLREMSELDTSNIISEGRVTRARRNIGSNKKPPVVENPPRHREARNTLKRLRTVVDSDSE